MAVKILILPLFLNKGFYLKFCVFDVAYAQKTFKKIFNSPKFTVGNFPLAIFSMT